MLECVVDHLAPPGSCCAALTHRGGARATPPPGCPAHLQLHHVIPIRPLLQHPLAKVVHLHALLPQARHARLILVRAQLQPWHNRQAGSWGGQDVRTEEGGGKGEERRGGAMMRNKPQLCMLAGPRVPELPGGASVGAGRGAARGGAHSPTHHCLHNRGAAALAPRNAHSCNSRNGER